MSYSYPNVGYDNTSEKLANARQYVAQLENLEKQRQQQTIAYNQPVLQQPIPQLTQQKQSNVDWITIRAYSEAKDIALSGYTERWFKVDNVPLIGTKFIEDGFEKTQYYELVKFDPSNQNQAVEPCNSKIDLTAYAKEDTVNNLIVDLNNKIVSLENKVLELEKLKEGSSSASKSNTSRKEVINNAK